MQVRGAMYKVGGYLSGAAASVGVYRGALYDRVQSTIDSLPLFDQVVHNWAIPILCGLSVSAVAHLLVAEIVAVNRTPGGTMELTRGSILQVSEDSQAGKQVVKGQYRFVKKMGYGGFSEIWLGEKISTIGQTEIVVPVAIKILLGGERNLERFQREAGILALLNHPNIVHYDNVGQLLDGRFYLVMDYIKGKTLGELTGIPIRAVLDIAIGISRALMAANDKGVIHRDIKPENIILIDDSSLPVDARVRVLDFGIADIEGENRLTQSHLVPGTPRYTAPETLKGERRTFKADMYSLGMLLYFLITGRIPFEEKKQDLEIFRAQIDAVPAGLESFEDFQKLRPDVTPQVYELLRRLIDKDPDKRPADYKDLIQALEQLRK